MKTFSEVQKLSSDELLTSLHEVCKHERAFAIQVIWHLVVVESRKLYLAAGYDGLFSYCVKVLKYDPGSAHRRVKAAKLWKEHPEVERDLESGELTLSSAAVLQTHFDHRKKHQVPVSKAAQKNLIEAARGKSRRELEAESIGELPVDIPRPVSRIKTVAKNLHRLELFVDDTFLEKLEELRALCIHAEPSGDAARLIQGSIDEKINRVKKRRFGAKSASPAKSRGVKTGDQKSGAREPKRTPVPAVIRAKVFQRDQGECQFKDPRAKRQCGSRFAIEIDHIQPIENGGQNTAENLRLLCSAHHRFRHLAYPSPQGRNGVRPHETSFDTESSIF